MSEMRKATAGAVIVCVIEYDNGDFIAYGELINKIWKGSGETQEEALVHMMNNVPIDFADAARSATLKILKEYAEENP